MISEKKLAYYEHIAEHTYSLECQKVITQLVDEVRKLECEADWLAQNCEILSGYNPILRQGMTKTQWREDAHKAVKKNDS